MTIEAVDVFCGVGGLSYGLKSAGVKVVAGIDNDPDCKYAFEENIGAEFLLSDIRKVSTSEIAAHFSKGCIRLIAGCAPCQKYSDLTNKEGTRSGRWRLLKRYAEIVFDVEPELVTMENVPNITKVNEFKMFVKGLKSRGYFVWYDVVKCADFGVPQNRHRLVLLASSVKEVDALSRQVDKWVTVRDVLGALPVIAAGESCVSDPLHRAARLSPINLERIQNSKCGGTWKDWPEHLRLQCHKNSKGASYTPVYGRMSWDKAAPTITTRAYNYGSGRFGHPDQDRCISIREAALLQSFPSNYRFFKDTRDITFSKAGRMIGNAVPPKLGEAIGLNLGRSC